MTVWNFEIFVRYSLLRLLREEIRLYKICGRVWTFLLALSLVLSLSTLGMASGISDIEGSVVGTEDVFMSVSDVKPGMKGTALTVIEGTTPESFDIEVVAILKQGGYLGDLIIFEASGPVIEKAGGIASGMSGSPVYIDGRLVGAIAYTFPGGDPNTGMITPIEDMLRILDYMENPQEDSLPTTTAQVGKDALEPWEGKSVAIASNYAVGNAMVDAGYGKMTGELIAVPMSTPITVSGIGARGLEILRSDLAEYNLSVVQGSGYDESDELTAQLVPGSSIGVQLAKGDVNVFAAGTITYIEDDSFLAFGHSLLSSGKSELIACVANIDGILKTSDSYGKLATAGASVGSVLQDRLNGIGGKFGTSVPTVPIEITVSSEDTKRERTTHVESVASEELLYSIVSAAALNTIDGVMERTGGGTAYVTYSVQLDDEDGTVFERSNVFWSSSDIASAAAGELVDTVAYISNNATEKVGIKDVKLSVKVVPDRMTARIADVRPLAETIAPGETLNLEVDLIPYRGEKFTHTVQVEIPDDAPEGDLYMLVRSGGFADVQEDVSYVDLDEFFYMKVTEMLDQIDQIDRNNQIVVEIDPYYNEMGWDEYDFELPEGDYGQYEGLEIAPIEDGIPDVKQQAVQPELEVPMPDVNVQNVDEAQEDVKTYDVKFVEDTEWIIEGSKLLSVVVASAQ